MKRNKIVITVTYPDPDDRYVPKGVVVVGGQLQIAGNGERGADSIPGYQVPEDDEMVGECVKAIFRAARERMETP